MVKSYHCFAICNINILCKYPVRKVTSVALVHWIDFRVNFKSDYKYLHKIVCIVRSPLLLQDTPSPDSNGSVGVPVLHLLSADSL